VNKIKKIVMKKEFLFLSIIGLIMFNTSCDRCPINSTECESSEPLKLNINLSDDMGQKPWVLDVENATLANTDYRVANWTGKYMQLVFMSLKPGEIIDLEIHDGHDQFIRIEKGEARVFMGKSEDDLSFEEDVKDDWAILIPAGYWHKVENIGSEDLKLYTLYGPAEHEAGTVHKTYQQAKDSHHHH